MIQVCRPYKAMGIFVNSSQGERAPTKESNEPPDGVYRNLYSLFYDEMACPVCHELWPRTKSVTINSERFNCSIEAAKKSATLQHCATCELLVRVVRKLESLCSRKVAHIQMHFVHPDEPADWLRGGEKNLHAQFQFDDDSWSDHYEFLCLPGEIFPLFAKRITSHAP
jgi:hypothetical protein